MTKFWFIPIIFFLMLLSSPVIATTLPMEGVSAYSRVADPGMVIYQITVNDLPIGTNQTHTFNTASGVFLLTINTYDQWGYKNADITVTLPNGTVQTAHCSALGLLIGQYKTDIQYVYPQIYSGAGVLSVSLVLGLTPASASFNAGAMGWDPANALAFTAVSGNVGGTTNIYIEEMSMNDFQKNVQNYNPAYGLSNLGSQVFQWAWSGVLGFLAMIPVIGPAMVSLLSAMGGIITTGVYWLIFVVSNFPAILCGIETLILMMAVINTPKKNSFSKLARNIYNYNVAFVLGVIGLADIVWSWTRSAVEMVAAIVQALKPI